MQKKSVAKASTGQLWMGHRKLVPATVLVPLFPAAKVNGTVCSKGRSDADNNMGRERFFDGYRHLPSRPLPRNFMSPNCPLKATFGGPDC